MILETFTKQPREKLDYDVLYEDWLPDTDQIDAGKSTVTADKPGLNVTFTVTGKVVKVWISGGANKTTYKVTLTIETDDGRVKQDEFIVKVKDY